MTGRDIVERLRFSATVNRSGGYDGDADEREEAATEIERLRAERDGVSERALCALESALKAAGMGMTDKEADAAP